MNWTRPGTQDGTRTSRRAVMGAAALLGTGLFAPSSLQASQQATPSPSEPAGLGTWAAQLATLDPNTIVDLVLAKPVNAFFCFHDLEAQVTDFTISNFPFPEDLLAEVSIGTTLPSTGEFELGTGTMLFLTSVDTATSALASIEPMESEEASVWAVPFAGLDARWTVSGDHNSSIVVQVGPVLVIGTDIFLTDGAYSHLMDNIQNVLQNTAHVLYHLFGATDQELGIA